jgi:5-methylthioadenosine/S-adenosylhomocysteine deaminase
VIKCLKNAVILKHAYDTPVRQNLLIGDDRIIGFYPAEHVPKSDVIIDLDGMMIIPGMVQSHVHLPQVMFRGLADDLPLLSWLKEKIWPLEASHDAESTYLSAMLGSMELIAGGVTTVCDMESVLYAEESARAIYEIGLRAVFGKVLMDYNDTPPELGGMPETFFESTKETIDKAMELYHGWHGKANNRIHFAFMPRGILTTTEELLQELAHLSSETGCLIHTHACETRPESELVEERRGLTEIKYLHKLGLTNERLLLAHCVCVDDDDIAILREKKIGVVSCPLTNLKLGSGIAPLEKMRSENVHLAFGSDGAPCNNNLDIFQEMKFASLLQKGTLHEPTAMNARDTFDIATRGGANSLGLDADIGTLEVGKKADLAVLDLDQHETAPLQYSVSSLVYAGNPHMVRHVMIDGRWVYWNGEFPDLDVARLREKALAAQKRVLSRYKNK